MKVFLVLYNSNVQPQDVLLILYQESPVHQSAKLYSYWRASAVQSHAAQNRKAAYPGVQYE